MIDIVERLRRIAQDVMPGNLCDQAADEIERLRKERDELVAAMRVLDVALKVGAPEYEYADWCDIVSEALAKVGADKTGE